LAESSLSEAVLVLAAAVEPGPESAAATPRAIAGPVARAALSASETLLRLRRARLPISASLRRCRERASERSQISTEARSRTWMVPWRKPLRRGADKLCSFRLSPPGLADGLA